MPATPDLDDPDVLSFCNEVCSGTTPVSVPVRTLPGAKWNNCYHNVARKRTLDGGDIAYGWAIWKRPGLLIEAEHRAVWVSMVGQMVDVSPHVNRETIVFLPDPATPFQGRSIPSRRKALTDDPHMAELIRLADRKDQIRMANTTAGGVVVTAEYMAVERQILPLQMALWGIGDSDEVAEQLAAMGQMRLMKSLSQREVPKLNAKERAERRKKRHKG